jgi:dihydroneopterin aldolase
VSDRIVVRGVLASGRHGFAHELHHPQPFVVDVELRRDLAEAARTDDLERTIDYSLVVQEVRRTVEQESFALIEALAQAVAERLLSFGAASVLVRVSKPAAALALGVDEVAVELQRGTV